MGGWEGGWVGLVGSMEIGCTHDFKVSFDEGGSCWIVFVVKVVLVVVVAVHCSNIFIFSYLKRN